MSADVFQADYEALESIANRFIISSGETASLLQSIKEQMNVLQNGDWLGRGSSAFFMEMEQDVLPAVARLSEAFTKANEVTLEVRTIIQEAEEQAANRFKTKTHVDNVETIKMASWLPVPSQTTAIKDVEPRDYALLSQSAYTDGGDLTQDMRGKGWQKLKQHTTNTGYSGTVYVNERTKEIVIAHRGTNPDGGDFWDGVIQSAAHTSPLALGTALVTGQPIDELGQKISRTLGINVDGSDLDDDVQLAIGKVPDQFYESQLFVRDVTQQRVDQGYEGYTITHTGHSLGGALADIHAASNSQRSITFDNPGAKEPLESIGQTYNPDNHITYQSHPNLINRTNSQAGHVTHIRLNTDSDKFGVIRDTLHHHKLEHMVDAMDPVTGRPYRLNENVL